MMNADGSQPQVILSNYVIHNFSWSPDGTRIVFDGWYGESLGIFVMNADGSDLQELRTAGSGFGVDWRPTQTEPPTEETLSNDTNGMIAFVSDRDGYGNGEIYTMNADGSNQTRLTFNSQWNGLPSWSPDGTQIAFYQHRTNNIWNIYVMNADGSNLQMLTDNYGRDSAPAWSPDGSLIAFTSEVSNQPSPQIDAVNTDIYVMNADGSNRRQLTFGESNDSCSSWSPDGLQIAFSSMRDRNWEIYIMNADGSDARRLTDDPAADWNPAWSPDGAHIVFWSERDGDGEIYLMDVDGSNLQKLTDNAAEDLFPAWSPDGTQIVFSSDRDGNVDVYVMNADGSNIRRLTDSRGIDFEADW